MIWKTGIGLIYNSSNYFPREFDIEELNNRTRLNLDYAAEKQKEILQLETAVTTLRNTTAVKEAQIQKLGEVKNPICLNFKLSS